MPLIRIVAVVVEFFVAVGIADVAPALGAEGVIALAVSGEGGASPFERRVFEQRDEAGAVERGDGRKRAQFVERGKEVDGADGPRGA